MESENKMTPSTMEMESLVVDEHVTVTTFTNNEGKEMPTTLRHPNNYEFQVLEKTNIGINKSLLTLRIAQFLWFGAGRIPALFLAVFLKHRGLTVVEFSSIFSFVFLFQFAACSIAGTIADKIGNAKPVLMFLMVASPAVLVCMIFTPSINTKSCFRQATDLNFTDAVNNYGNITDCKINCLQSEEKYFFHDNDTGNTTSFSANQSDFFHSFNNNEMNNISSDLENLNPFHDTSGHNCSTACASSLHTDCPSSKKRFVVVIYAVLILVLFSVWPATYRFMDFTALSLAEKNDSYFGKERFIATTGEFSIAILLTFVINIEKSAESDYIYDTVYWVAASVILCSFIFVCCTRVPILPPGRKLMHKAFTLVRNPDVLAFLIIVFVAGNGFCFSINFHLWFLETLNAPRIVIGLYAVTFSLYGLLVLLTSKWWLKKFGTNKIFVLGLLCYSINNTAYSFLYNPWFSLIIEFSIAFSYHLFWVAAVVHSKNIAPDGFAATLNALVGSIHFGVGRSSGVLGGGLLVNFLGLRKAYRTMAAFYLTTAILYLIFLYKRRKSPGGSTRINV